MAAVTICSDFGATKNKVWYCFHCFPIYFPWNNGTNQGSLVNRVWEKLQIQILPLEIMTVPISTMKTPRYSPKMKPICSLYINTCIWNLESWYQWTHLQDSNGDAYIENRLVHTMEEGKGGTNCENSVETCILPYVKQIASGTLLCDTGGSTQCSVTTSRDGMGQEMGGGFRKEGTYVCLWLIHVDVWQKPTHYMKQLSSSLKKIFFFS